MDNGWIKLHNKFLRWEWADEPNMVALWIHFLLSANWKDREWQGITIKRGQLVCGRKQLSKQTGLSEQEIRTCMAKFKISKELTIKSTNKYSIITLLKWEEYQSNKKKQPTTQPTINQQSTTPKEYKNIRYKDIKYDLKNRKGLQTVNNLIFKRYEKIKTEE